jgi:murein tripeptide amidase MpaA
LQKHPTSSLSTFVYFAADECGTADTKFVLFFHQQDEQQGFMVDIHSLANDSYLAKQQNGNFIEVTSCTAPANKFLIIPVLDGQ